MRVERQSRLLYLEPISACNLRCRMCYTNVVNGTDRRIVPSAVLLDFVNRFTDATPGLVEVYWCGTGEVFLHREFPEVVRRILAEYPEERVTQRIQTNGTLDRLDEIGSLERLDFNVSIDGSREFHEWHRGQGTYETTLAFCRRVFDLGGRSVAVRCLLTRENIHHLDAFHAELVERVGPRVELLLYAPYTNPALRAVRSTALAIRQSDMEDAAAMPREEAERILAEQYPGRYALDEGADRVDNYLSLTTYGVFTCCHGILRIGEPGDEVPVLRERMAAREDDCRRCAMFPCM